MDNIDNKDNDNMSQVRAELDEKYKRSRLMQKKIIIILCAAVLCCLICCSAVIVADMGWLVTLEDQKKTGYEFDAFMDFDYDIMTDAAYRRLLEDEPLVSFCNLGTGETATLEPSEYGEHGAVVKLLTDFLLAIQSGNVDAYNSFFSEEYLNAVGREESFTMQQIYSAVITAVSEREDEQTGTKTYVYRLKYKIRRNNGTLRLDMGSDCYREQELLIKGNSDDSELKIYSVTVNSTVNQYKIVHYDRIAIFLVVIVALNSGCIVAAVVVFRKLSKKYDN